MHWAMRPTKVWLAQHQRNEWHAYSRIGTSFMDKAAWKNGFDHITEISTTILAMQKERYLPLSTLLSFVQVSLGPTGCIA
jgi:hypothetical protein